MVQRTLALLTVLVATVLGVNNESAEPVKTYHGSEVLVAKLNVEVDVPALKAIDRTIDWWSEPRIADGTTHFHIEKDNLAKIKAYLDEMGREWKVAIPNVQELIDQQKQEVPADVHAMQTQAVGNPQYFNRFLSYTEISAFLDDMVSKYPALAKKVSIGKTGDNRDTYGLEMTGVGSHSTKRLIYMQGALHAREWSGTSSVMYVIDQLLSQYNINPAIKVMMDSFAWTIVPVANPDGYEYTQTVRLWRKNRQRTAGVACLGVDPNRNFPAGFGTVGISTDPCDDQYCGKAAFSTQESINIQTYTQSHRNMVAFLDVHAFGQYLLTPYGYKAAPPPAGIATEQAQMSAKIVAAMKAKVGTVYKAGPTYSTIYPASGGALDWVFEQGVTYSMVFELRDEGVFAFLLPASDIISQAEEFMLGISTMTEILQTKYVPSGPYTWLAGEYGLCSAICNGMNVRDITCVDSKGVAAAGGDVLCASSGVKPLATRTCNLPPCTGPGGQGVGGNGDGTNVSPTPPPSAFPPTPVPVSVIQPPTPVPVALPTPVPKAIPQYSPAEFLLYPMGSMCQGDWIKQLGYSNHCVTQKGQQGQSDSYVQYLCDFSAQPKPLMQTCSDPQCQQCNGPVASTNLSSGSCSAYPLADGSSMTYLVNCNYGRTTTSSAATVSMYGFASLLVALLFSFLLM